MNNDGQREQGANARLRRFSPRSGSAVYYRSLKKRLSVDCERSSIPPQQLATNREFGDKYPFFLQRTRLS